MRMTLILVVALALVGSSSAQGPLRQSRLQQMVRGFMDDMSDMASRIGTGMLKTLNGSGGGPSRENRPGIPARKRRPVPVEDPPARLAEEDNLVAPNHPQRHRPVVRQERPRLSFRQFVDGTMAGIRNLFPSLRRRNFHRSARDVQVSPPAYVPPHPSHGSGVPHPHPDPMHDQTDQHPDPDRPTVQVTVNVYNQHNNQDALDKDVTDDSTTKAPEYNLSVTHHTDHSFSVVHTSQKDEATKGQQQTAVHSTTVTGNDYSGSDKKKPLLSDTHSIRRSDALSETEVEWEPERIARSDERSSLEEMQYGAQSLDMIYGYYFGNDRNGHGGARRPPQTFGRQTDSSIRHANDRQDFHAGNGMLGYKDGFLQGYSQGFESGTKFNGNRVSSGDGGGPNSSQVYNNHNVRVPSVSNGNNFATNYNNNNNAVTHGQVSSGSGTVTQYAGSGGGGSGPAGCGVRCLWDDLMNILDHYSNNGDTEASKVAGASFPDGAMGHEVHQQHGSGGANTRPSANYNTPVNSNTQNTDSYEPGMEGGAIRPSQRHQGFDRHRRPFQGRRPPFRRPQAIPQDDVLYPGPPYSLAPASSSPSYDLIMHNGRILSGHTGQTLGVRG